MRISLLTAPIVVCLLSTPALHAGLYNTAEPPRGPRVTPDGVKPVGFTQFRDVLNDLSSIGNPIKESSQRNHYLAKRDELLAKERRGGLTTEEKVNLSEYLIRLHEFEKAVELLTPVAAQERRNFMVYANLGTAHQLAGRLDRAREYLADAKENVPEEWPSFTKEQLAWYREAENYHYRLVKLRYRESLSQPAGRGKAVEKLDDLFDTDKGQVRFQGENGQYEAGKMAAAERAKLPPHAVAIVQQLLVWVPGAAPGMEDHRLLWLLGELYNSAGDIEGASQVFQTLVWSYRYDAPELREHRKVVQAALPDPTTSTPAPAQVTVPPVAETPASLPSWPRIALVAGLLGLVVAGLIYMQMREARRRRKSVD